PGIQRYESHFFLAGTISNNSGLDSTVHGPSISNRRRSVRRYFPGFSGPYQSFRPIPCNSERLPGSRDKSLTIATNDGFSSFDFTSVSASGRYGIRTPSLNSCG